MIFAELKHRKKRVITTIISFVIGIILLLIIQSLASGFKILAGKPMEKIGCNITVQKSGNIPEKMEGAVLPCAAVTIKKTQIDQISSIKSIKKLSKAILIWLFEKDKFYSVLGIESTNPIGPGLLKNHVVEGRFINKSGLEVVIEKTFAQSNKYKLGQVLILAGHEFTIVGIVDVTQLGKMITANVYIPLTEATRIASESEGIQKIAPLHTGDATILFTNVKQNELKTTDAEIKKIIGKKASVSSPLSILEKFKGIIKFFIAFSHLLIAIVAITAIVIITLSLMQSVNLRKHEFGIFKAVGWKPSEIKRYMVAETVLISFISSITGVILSYIVIHLLGFISIDIPIPWESNSSTPHFLMDNPSEKTTMNIQLPVIISLQWIISIVVTSNLIGLIIGYFAGNKVNKLNPSEAVKNG